jgi:acetyltransferase-like isoleucine patch superfamily enzyme
MKANSNLKSLVTASTKQLFNRIARLALASIVTALPKLLFKKMVKLALASIEHEEHLKIKNSLAYCGENVRLGNDIDVIGSSCIRIGENFSCAKNVKLHCWQDALVAEPSLKIGKNVFINSMSYISCASQVNIADDVLLGSNVFITDNYHGDTSKVIQSRLQAPLFSKGPVKIGAGVWLGNNVCILPNVSIGDNAIVGANSVVTKDVPSGTIVTGVPAKHLRSLH